MKKFKKLLSSTLLCSFISFGVSNSSVADVESVNSVDLQKYIGKWYEIASYPMLFQTGCMCTTAEYSIDGENIKVDNKCYQSKYVKNEGYDRKLLNSVGTAFPVEGSNNAKLQVQFAPPFKGDYWVIDRDENYTYSVVSNPERSTLWILSRTPRMNISTYEAITNRLVEKGYDLSKLKRTLQHCGN